MASESAPPFPPGFNIFTSRLRIIPFDLANQKHAEFLVQLWNTEDFINSCGRTSISTPEKASNFIRQRVLQQYSVNKYGMFLVSLKEGENTSLSPIGTVSLMKGAPPDLHFLAPDIGFAVLPEHSGKGYAAEAAKGLLEWARTDRGVEAAFGFCDPSNRRSRKVLQKIGMEFKGTAELQVFGGKTSAVYALPEMGDDLVVYGLAEPISPE
jgi:RimJ/RimL family protein N-acetyltransferase